VEDKKGENIKRRYKKRRK